MSTTNPVIYSIDDLRKAADDLGSHYFEPATMRFFNSRVLEGIYRPSIQTHPRTGLFVTSERFSDYSQGFVNPRLYSIRRFTITRTTCPYLDGIGGRTVDLIEFETVGEFQEFATAATAKRHAAKLGASL
jgi:hypothetical protein